VWEEDTAGTEDAKIARIQAQVSAFKTELAALETTYREAKAAATETAKALSMAERALDTNTDES
jgi:hypothetical protein